MRRGTDCHCESNSAQLTAQGRAFDSGEHEDRDDHRTNKDCADRVQSVIRWDGGNQRSVDTRGHRLDQEPSQRHAVGGVSRGESRAPGRRVKRDQQRNDDGSGDDRRQADAVAEQGEVSCLRNSKKPSGSFIRRRTGSPRGTR